MNISFSNNIIFVGGNKASLKLNKASLKLKLEIKPTKPSLFINLVNQIPSVHLTILVTQGSF